ncbi:MAG TPA: copper homeostasis protein CutC [Planctomycetota bacterium]|nr:copper homeostasis protein CutC [Planctomycetota bacterium]
MAILEVCVDSRDQLAAALGCGAARLEVCSRLDLGGLTPTPELLAQALQAAGASAVRVHAMVRSRADQAFVPSEAEFSELRADLLRVKKQGAHGVVFGVLTSDACVDLERTRQLIALARPMTVTFHRAFDLVRDPSAELEVLIELGVDRLLTSGAAASALEGLDTLRALVARARGRIVILPGGGVRAHNAAEILARTGASELHSSHAFRIPRSE